MFCLKQTKTFDGQNHLFYTNNEKNVFRGDSNGLPCIVGRQKNKMIFPL